MQTFKAKSLRFCLVASVALSLSLGGCSFSSESKSEDKPNPDGLNVTVTEPIERDYSEIKGDGVLRMITRYNSNTYFLHQGVEWGFEYELVHRFAEQHDLALEVVIIGPDDNPYDMLNSGEGDIIAANYARKPVRKNYVEFTRPYNVVKQQMVFSDGITNPPQKIEQVAQRNIPVTVRRNSSYYQRLKKLRDQGYNIPIHLVSNKKDTESLLYEVSDNEYPATVADNNIFQASNRYMEGLVRGPVIAESDTIAWAVRKNAPDLKSELNKYLYDHFRFAKAGEAPKRSTFLNVLRKRYFESGPQIAQYYNPESEISTAGAISPYDQIIKRVADSAGVDWLLVASIAAQETKFNPNSKSWAGAVGIMQILPQYSEVADKEMLYDVETNLREGVRIFKEHLKHYSYMDSTNQWSFALASYNAGRGHLADARRLAIDHNDNPNEWDNASDALLKLMQRKYYKDARYGFCRGIETVRYVKEIKNRYKTYETILAMNERDEGNTGFGIMGLFNVP